MSGAHPSRANGPPLLRGLALALSWLTVLPVPVRTVDRRVAAAAIALAPVAGLLLGALGAGVATGVAALGAPPLLAGLLTVAVLAVATRGMHLDGLADTADGLGCYGDAARALEVMREGGTGPFAVVALVLGLGVQAVCFGTLAAHGHWPAVVLAVVAGRVAFGTACRRGVPAARADGLGALVAGGQHPATVAAWWLVLAAAAGFLVTPWLAVAVVLAAVAVLLLVWHTARRFGGVTGDVLGACCELAVTVTAAAAVLVLGAAA